MNDKLLIKLAELRDGLLVQHDILDDLLDLMQELQEIMSPMPNWSNGWDDDFPDNPHLDDPRINQGGDDEPIDLTKKPF